MDIKDKVLIDDYCSLPSTFLLNGQPRRGKIQTRFFFFHVYAYIQRLVFLKISKGALEIGINF